MSGALGHGHGGSPGTVRPVVVASTSHEMRPCATLVARRCARRKPRRCPAETPTAGRFTGMRDGGHCASVVSWDGLGVEIASGEGTVTDAVAARAWCCSCGWRGAVRPVDDRFYRPPGDVDGRLRTARVRRSDRTAHAAWAHHRLAVSEDDAPAAQTPVHGDGVDGVPVASAAPEDGDRGAVDRRGRRPEVDAPARGSGGADAPGPVVSARAERARLRHPQPSVPATRQPSTASRGGAGEPPPPRAVDPTAATPGAEGTSHAADITRGAARVDRAHREMSAADTDLRDAVRRARAGGLSWRAIAIAAGVDHRDARERWTSGSEADTAF